MKILSVILVILSIALAGCARDKQGTPLAPFTTEFRDRLAYFDFGSPESVDVFLRKLQAGVQAYDSSAVADLVCFPVRVNDPGEASTRIARDAFLREYNDIITDNVRAAVLRQSTADLFIRDQGIMIGDGQIWFCPKDNFYGIIAVNRGVPTTKSTLSSEGAPSDDKVISSVLPEMTTVHEPATVFP